MLILVLMSIELQSALLDTTDLGVRSTISLFVALPVAPVTAS